jgi:hypothetical protein
MRTIYIIGLVIIMGVIFSLPSAALASDTFDWKTNLLLKSEPEHKLKNLLADPEQDYDWHLAAGAFTGMSTDNQAYYRLSTVVKSPDGPGFLNLIMPDSMWAELININDEEWISFMWFVYSLGESNNFYGVIFRDDYDSAIGMRYNPGHWNENLAWMDLSVLMREGSRWLVAYDARTDLTRFIEGADGYGIEIHGLWYFDENMGTERIDGRVAFWHNYNPEGTLWGEAFVDNRFDKQIIGYGVGGFTN